jgi:transaldolase
VYEKIPITNSRGESSIALVKELAETSVQLNVTAILTGKARKVFVLSPASG